MSLNFIEHFLNKFYYTSPNIQLCGFIGLHNRHQCYIQPITTQNSSPTSSLLAVSGSTGGTGGVYSFTVGEGVAGTPSADVSFSCSTQRQKYIYPYYIEAWKLVYFPQMIFNQASILHFTHIQAFIYFRALNPCVDFGPMRSYEPCFYMDKGNSVFTYCNG